MWWNKAPQLDSDLEKYVKDAVDPDPRPVPLGKAHEKREIAAPRSSKSVHQVAMDNCVEYERAFSTCLQSGSYWDRFTSCQTQKQMHNKCVELQELTLQVLGYARGDLDKRLQLKGAADDLMLQYLPKLTITEEQEQRYREKLESIGANGAANGA